MATKDKIPVCFLCLRIFEKKQVGQGYFDGDVDPLNCDSGDRLLLKRFLACALGLREPLFGDLLSTTNDGTGGGQGPQGQGGNLLCGSCEIEVGAACQLYQELAIKLMELDKILKNSVKRVSDKLRANLYQQVAKQVNLSFGSKKKSVQLVQKARELLSLELKSATDKAKRVEDELSGSGASEIDDSEGTNHENRKRNVLETETETVKQVSDQGQVGVKESGATEATGVNDGGGDCGQRNGGSTSTSVSTAKGKEKRGLGVEVDRPFVCPNCSASYWRIDALQTHQLRCRPMVSTANGKSSTTSKKADSEKSVEPGNGSFLREDVHIDMTMEAWRNSSAAAAEAQTVSFQCLRCKDRFKNIEDVKKHEEWCKPKPMEVQDLETKCRMCGKNFASKDDLKTHELIHMRPYQCPKCKMQFNFNQKSDCKAHMKICKVFKPSVEMKNCQEIDPLEVTTTNQDSGEGDSGNGEMKLEVEEKESSDEQWFWTGARAHCNRKSDGM